MDAYRLATTKINLPEGIAMNIRSALKTKTRKAALAGAVIATTVVFGVTGTAAAYSSNNWGNNNHSWKNKDNDHNKKKYNCHDAFWVYNHHKGKWIKIGYNQWTGHWEACHDKKHRYHDGNYSHDDGKRYSNDKGRYEHHYRAKY